MRDTSNCRGSLKWGKFLRTLYIRMRPEFPPWGALKVEPSTLDVSHLDTCGWSSNNLFDSARLTHCNPTVFLTVQPNQHSPTIVYQGSLRVPQGDLCVTRMNAQVCMIVWSFTAFVHYAHGTPMVHLYHPHGTPHDTPHGTPHVIHRGR